MSYVLSPFLVDLERLRKAVGGRDESLIAAVVAAKPARFQIPEDEHAGMVSPSQALRQLVMGEELDKDSAVQYGFALKMLCGQIGDVILPDAWGGVSWRALVATGLDKVLMQSGPPVPLPPMPGSPVIGHLTAEEVAAKVLELGDAHPSNDDEDLQELLEEYWGWLREAARKKKDIVLFYG
jgi:hypothetical protein